MLNIHIKEGMSDLVSNNLLYFWLNFVSYALLFFKAFQVILYHNVDFFPVNQAAQIIKF